MKTSYNIITYNRLDRFWEKILISKEYFDTVRIVDANSTDGTKGFCETHDIKYIPFDLRLNIMDMWGVALEDAKSNDEAWFFWADSDEWFTRDFLRNIDHMIEASNDGQVYNSIVTPCWELSIDNYVCRPYESYQERLAAGETPWYLKEKGYKLYDDMICTGCAHPDFKSSISKKNGVYNYGYYHSKTIKELNESGMIFAFAEIMADMEMGIVREHFTEDEIRFLKTFCQSRNIDTIPKFRDFVNNGEFPDELRDFVIGCREGMSCSGPTEYSNSRSAFFMFYFWIRFPELRPEEFVDFYGDKWFYRGDVQL
jgi:glycosyltransferase involved in cell wall biosynthesis